MSDLQEAKDAHQYKIQGQSSRVKDNRDKSIYILSQPQNWMHDSFEDIKLSTDESVDLS